MKKILYILEFLVFILSLGEILLVKYVPSLAKFEPYSIYFIIILMVSVLLILITMGISFYSKEIGCDVKHKKQPVKDIARKKVIFDDVTKTELGIPLQPEKVLDEDSHPDKIVEENTVAESVIAVEEPTIVDEVVSAKPLADDDLPVEESTTEDVQEEIVEEDKNEETPVEEVTTEEVEEPVAEEVKEEPVVEEETVTEETPVEETVTENVEETPVEETTTEVVEEVPVEEVVEETVTEETPVEETVTEEVEEPVVEEVKDEPIAEEVKEETIEEVKESVEEVKEEAPAEEPVVEETPKGPKLTLKPTVLTPFRIFNDFTYSIGKHWTELFQGEVDKTYFKDMVTFLQEAYDTKNVYPPKEDLMKCFEYCDFDNTRVVIIGKFPFYRKNQADGLAFSTRAGKSPNQTTSIIIKEAISDVGIPVVNTGSLVNWAKNGVLLLNSIMTAPSDKPASHSDCGWITFTNKIIELLNMDSTPKAFVLWGEYAQGLKSLITNPNHLVLEAPNPSPLSAANGFYGSKPFSKINEFLEKNNIDPIDWTL